MKKSEISRRRFIGTTAAISAFSILPFSSSLGTLTQGRKPDSKVGGVQPGNITNNLTRMTTDIDEFIGYLTYIDINSVELRSFAEESLGISRGARGMFAGPAGAFPGGGQRSAPSGVPGGARGVPGSAPGGGRPGAPGGQRPQMSEEERAERAKAAAEAAKKQREWRLSIPMSKYSDMRKKFDAAGIKIHIAKFAPATWSDEEIYYAFKAAAIPGAYGITDELGDDACKRLGSFAEKHNNLAVFHNHYQLAEPGFSYDKYLAYSPANRINFDAGHYFGSTGLHPNGIIEKYHDRISSIHIKDKTGPKSTPANNNMPFGEGETPISDILLLLKKEKWPINVDV